MPTPAQNQRCPRCDQPRDTATARSRATAARDIAICSACATDEAVRDAAGRAPVPLDEWPLRSTRPGN
ncbi:hypothetical protein OG858_46930 (plasmid) [Streptomyces europaeiscabiei]|uniref:hypothetical protein n=1 Tax=Streptomyces europaeiscabiei TaxID=146819 RepID=UPI002E7FD16D|nr:hypothetical protein [Streptomyces europaeiscabiei]WUD38844.1 hypothetical protein OG858_46930 [Streptomyces europaeiscabiei]